jgi:hypothetical protein
VHSDEDTVPDTWNHIITRPSARLHAELDDEDYSDLFDEWLTPDERIARDNERHWQSILHVYVVALNFRTLKQLLRGSNMVSNCNKLRLRERITTVKQSKLLNSKQHPTYLIQLQQSDSLMASLVTLWTLMTTRHRPQHQHLRL